MIIKEWAKLGFLWAALINVVSMIGANLSVRNLSLNDLFIAIYFLSIPISGILAMIFSFLSLRDRFGLGIAKTTIFLILSSTIGFLSSVTLYL
jgi:hypothetical protein